MHLLNTKTLRLHDFPDLQSLPEYAVLSHTWAANFDEVSAKELAGWLPWYKRKSGWSKIKGCCRQAVVDDIDFLWVDTCCVDRSQPDQVADALQRTWDIYRTARVCYVHLADVQSQPRQRGGGSGRNSAEPALAVADSPDSDFRRSRWFTRGWTLPELVAPQYVRFYDRSWRYVGAKAELSPTVHDATGIPPRVLRDPDDVRRQSVAHRLAWAAARHTTREEDAAYCLPGLFDVSLPPEYGEGASKAFVRLQYQILRACSDQSVFSWGFDLPLSGSHVDRKVAILAERPSSFRYCGPIEPLPRQPDDEPPFEVTTTGLRLQLPMQIDERTGTALIDLQCSAGSGDSTLVLPLSRSSTARKEFERNPYSSPVLVPAAKVASFSVRPITVQIASRPHAISKHIKVSLEWPGDRPFDLLQVYPPNALQDIQTPSPFETPGTHGSLYLIDLPWSILYFQNRQGVGFLLSLEKEESPTREEPRPMKVRVAKVPAPTSPSAGGSTSFSLVELLPLVDDMARVEWHRSVDIGNMRVSTEFLMPRESNGNGNAMRTVRLLVFRDAADATSRASTSKSDRIDGKRRKKR